MRGDARRHQPFAEHFVLEVLAEVGSEQDARLVEEYLNWRWHATGPCGYNTRRSSADAIGL
jgi:hypothetical protein